ncbi:hypothetical protein AB4Y45_34100 [Paraburkholderia sp. EG287A]|uniref:hypothetical protein n=1 Tax=Paraburkholderia sp. EG287A TaxID=3237012 RepID=UPI0034D24DC9
MNLLVIDATSSRVAFAVFSASTHLEEILVGRFDSSGGDPLSIRDAVGRELASTAIPQGLGEEAYIGWVMQWLEARNIRVDVICHRVVRGAYPGGSHKVIAYLRHTHGSVPQVACALESDRLAALAHEGLNSLALPLVSQGTHASPNWRSLGDTTSANRWTRI